MINELTREAWLMRPETSEKNKGSKSRMLMIYEPSLKGHRLEFLLMHAQYALTSESSSCLLLVTEEGIIDALNNFFPDWQSSEQLRVIVVSHLRKNRISTIKQLQEVNSIACDESVDHCHFQSMNELQVPLALGFFKKISFSGIWLMPFTRQQELSLVRRLIKSNVLRMIAQKQECQSVILLNDAPSAEKLNRLYRVSEKFIGVPDPVVNLEVQADLNIRSLYNIPDTRQIGLFFGEISYRKGIQHTISVLKCLDKALIRRLAVLIIGRPSGISDEWLQNELKSLKDLFPEIWIKFDHAFVPPGEVQTIFDQSDFVFLTYQQTEGSSNILGRSALAGIPVLGPKEGLIGELIYRNNLGESVDFSDVDQAVGALTNIIEKQGRFSFRQAEAYAETCQAFRFSQRLFSSALDDSY